ncbi:MFS transporter [Persicobacter diffluens]|uniref:Glucose transporter n=1 Tax=Persicobacter diffluens TaxID=981 RepID=A0AAN4VYP8_9BACT|nr:glucose transporter [Persicobacter diffluens]
MAEVMEKKTNQGQETNYTKPFIILVALFFVVGFLTTANGQFQAPLKTAFLANAGNLKNTLVTLITFAFFMGYPAMGGVSSRWIDKLGYRNTLIRGLVMLVAALGVFRLSVFADATLGSVALTAEATVPYAFFIFLAGSFFMGCSLAVLQVVINPYLVSCNVPGTTSVTRMSIGGSSNSIGTTIAPYFVAFLVFKGVENPAVEQMGIPFFGLMAAVALVAFIMSKLELPEIQGTTSGGDVKLEKSVWSFTHLFLGVVGIFVYVGVEICIGSNINLYAEDLGLPTDIYTLMAALYWGGMLAGRLLGSTLSRVAAQTQLAVAASGALVLVTAGMLLNQPWFLVGAGVFHSIMWGAIFALALDKLGKYTTAASGALMIGVAGGAIIPWFQGIAADVMGGWQWTWILVIACEAYILFYALIGHKHSLAENA